MKRAVFILLVALLAAVATWLFNSRCCTRPQPSAIVAAPQHFLTPAIPPPGATTPPDPSSPEGQPPAAHAAEPVPVEENQGMEATEATPAEEMPELSPEQALETLKVMFVNYGQRFKGNPVGNNAEITAALDGDNPQGVHFLDPARDHMNDKGELVDGWGTPYFFHQLGGYDMEIHSAGPDRKMWTQDDLVTR